MQDQHYAWLAGILDGEGCFTLFRNSQREERVQGGPVIRYSIRANITITNSSAAIMDECERLLTEAEIKYFRICPRNSHTRKLSRISIRNYQSIVRLLDYVDPHLVGKAAQAALMRTFVEGAGRQGMGPTERERYHLEMSALNRRGSPIP